jgi:parvulin-like peptidyl-prolyl isomerase
MKYNVKVTNSDVNNAVDQIVNQNGGQDKVEQVLNELYGLNLNQFKSLVRTQLVRQNFSNDAIMKTTASHILIRVDQNAKQADVDTAKAKITDIRNQIESGSISFADAAKKYSEDTGSASNGGQLDPFAPGDMVKEFSDAAFATSVGKISEPIRSEYGFHIIKVESRTGKINESFTDWLAGIKKKSLILKFYK